MTEIATATGAPTAADVPTIERINEIVRSADPDSAAVNREITRNYHLISEAVRQALGATDDLDWCGFAKWSSHTVGFDLDPHEVGLRIQTLTADVPGALHSDLIASLKAATQIEDHLVVKALRAGNVVIFREMASISRHLLDRLLAGPEAAGAISDEAFATTIVPEVLNARDPAHPEQPIKHLISPITQELLDEPDSQPLVDGLLFYLRAAREPEHRSELMLAGSMKFSVYEQARADRLITIGTLAPIRSPLIRGLGLTEAEIERMLLSKQTSNLWLRLAENLGAELLTAAALVVEIAHTRVRLGKPDLLVPQVFPKLPEVAAILDEQQAKLSTTPKNWLRLDYRLGVIAKYFAAFQQMPDARAEPDVP